MKNFLTKIPEKMIRHPKISLPIVWAGILAMAILDGENPIEISQEKISATKITETTGKSVKNILEISDLCEKWKILQIKKPRARNNEISVEFSCQEKSISENVPSAYGSPNPF